MWDFRNPFFFIILELLKRVKKIFLPVASTHISLWVQISIFSH